MLANNVLLEQKTTSTLKAKNPANAYDSKSVKFTTFFSIQNILQSIMPEMLSRCFQTQPMIVIEDSEIWVIWSVSPAHKAR